jgi:hypothetical protein
MSISHTPAPEDKPGYYGEYRLGKFLTRVADDELELWFGVNYLANVGEIDVLMCHPRFGAVVVEVKGHNHDQVKSYSRQEIEYTNNQHGHPAKQARLNAQRLATWFNDQRGVFGANPPFAPWAHSIAWWPNMYRSEWNEMFAGQAIAIEDGEVMLFAEDTENGDEHFLSIVTRLRATPLFGGGPIPGAALSNTTAYQAFTGLINAQVQVVRPVPIVGRKPPRTILPTLFDDGNEPQIVSIEPEKLFVEQRVFTGPPGTGKTLRLMREGIKRANAGEDVLFVCFNKTLAAEMRRDFAQKIPALSDGKIFATHIYALVRYLLPAERHFADSAKDYFAHMVAAVRKSIEQEPTSVERFDTLLIDESQDLSEDAIQLLRLISKPDSSWFVAYGEGQQLYEPFEAAPTLLDWKKSARERELRRNYRSGTHAFFTNQAFYEFGKAGEVNVDRAKDWASKLIASNVENLKSDAANFLDIDFAPAATSSIQVISSERNMTKELVSDVLTTLMADMVSVMSDAEVNALIIVKGRGSQAYTETLGFLRQKGLVFFDLVQDANKNEIPTNTAIRIVTHLSARGLSADLAVVFDFDEIPEKNRRNVTYVLLSRASKKTVVAVRQRFITDHTTRLVDLANHVRSELLSRGYE